MEGNGSRGLGWSRDDIARHLRTTSVFRRLDDGILTGLASCATVLTFPAGDVLMREGEHGSDAFVVVAGRLDVAIDNGGGPVGVGTLGAGEVVGEMALLTDEPRSATVTARRDTAVLRIPAPEFRALVFEHPEVLLDVTRTVMQRLDRSIHDRRPDRRTAVVAVLPSGRDDVHHVFAERFAALSSASSVEVVPRERVESALGGAWDTSQLAPYLHRLEDANDLVLLVGDEPDAPWSAACGRQADISLVVGRPGAFASTRPADRRMLDADAHVVLVHATERPTGTAALVRSLGGARHHHVRDGSDADVARVARIVTGGSVGVVFGGGGARGFAHLGALRALLDAGIPIDHVAGSSIGSSVAAGVAMGWEWDRMVAGAKSVTFERGPAVDFTVPAVAIGRGRRLSAGIREQFGEIDIEDLWTEFVCVSTDLTVGEVHIHRNGRLWEAVRASVAIPGLLPPMPSPAGHVLVDGGVLDNLPVDAMRRSFAPDRVIAVDVRAATSLSGSDLPRDGAISGWRFLRTRMPGQERQSVPGIVETLLAASTVSGHSNPVDVDLLLTPDVSGFGMLDFSRADELIERGYEDTVRSLAETGMAFAALGG